MSVGAGAFGQSSARERRVAVFGAERGAERVSGRYFREAWEEGRETGGDGDVAFRGEVFSGLCVKQHCEGFFVASAFYFCRG